MKKPSEGLQILQDVYGEDIGNRFFDEIFTLDNKKKMAKAENVDVFREIVNEVNKKVGCLLLPCGAYRQVISSLCTKFGVLY